MSVARALAVTPEIWSRNTRSLSGLRAPTQALAVSLRIPYLPYTAQTTSFHHSLRQAAIGPGITREPIKSTFT